MADTGPRGPQGPAGTSIDLPVAVANGGTGATSAKAAANSLAVCSLTGGTEIPSGSDLNDYRAVGNYYSAGAAVSASLGNAPVTTSAFMLKVMNGYSNAVDSPSMNYIIQEACSSSAPTKYTRAYQNGNWTKWCRDFNAYTTVPVENGGTGATNEGAAANGLAVPSLVAGTAIPSGSNLDDYKTAGNYRAESAAMAATITNTPYTSGAFNLLVMKPYASTPASNSYVKQVLMGSYNASYFFIRVYEPNSGTWSAWYKYAGTQV